MGTAIVSESSQEITKLLLSGECIILRLNGSCHGVLATAGVCEEEGQASSLKSSRLHLAHFKARGWVPSIAMSLKALGGVGWSLPKQGCLGGPRTNLERGQFCLLSP